jgi:hypothetical protein
LKTPNWPQAARDQGETDVQHWRFPVAIAALPQALSEVRKRDRIPIVTVLPGPSDLKTGVSENTSNAPVRELVAVLGVNRFAWHEVKIKFRVPDTYILLSRTLEVHLDPRLDGIPKRAVAEASGVKVGR